MVTKFILFQGSFTGLRRNRRDAHTASDREFMSEFSSEFGRQAIGAGFGIILNSGAELDTKVGQAATEACVKIGITPSARIRTYPYGDAPKTGFGMVMEPIDKRWQEVRTFVVGQCDATVAIGGGKGTSDVVQKSVLANKPVFPVAVVSGGSKNEWERLKLQQAFNQDRGDLDFLGDLSLSAPELAKSVVQSCKRIFEKPDRPISRRVFIVHGHDGELKSQVARFLERIDLVPVILQEQVDAGRTIFAKLQDELNDVGFGFILLTPDDKGSVAAPSETMKLRARQNVVFEHGLLIGLLGADRVCALVKGELEIPSDLNGVIYKSVPDGGGLQSIELELFRELTRAGFELDAELLVS